MSSRIVSAPSKPVRRLAALLAAGAAVVALPLVAQAQQQQQQRPAQQQQQKPAPQKPAAPQAPAQQGAQQQPQQPQLPIVYSPWTKFCGKDQQQANAKEVCLTVKEARLETGQFVAGAALIEQDGEQRKILRITLPLGMQLNPGTRMIIDQGQPTTGRYVVCLPNGCMADFEVNQEFVGRLKKGQQLTLQGINLGGQAASYPIPLAEFAKANEGPPTDPKVFEEQQKKLQEELQRRAEEARKKLLERGQSAAPEQPAQPDGNKQ